MKDSSYGRKKSIEIFKELIRLSFASIKETGYALTRKKICQILTDLYVKYSYIKDSDPLTDTDKNFFDRILAENFDDSDATLALHKLSDFLMRYYGKKVVILLDEYDTPMQEAYIHGFWEELIAFTRSLFNATFKTNPYLGRAIMTGITWYRIEVPLSLGSKKPRQVNKVGLNTRLEKTTPSIQCQSVFSDFNNLKVVTTTSDEYATSFGFTEHEVFNALDEQGLGKEKDEVKRWYDGFVFGNCKDIYNPWSILNFLDTHQYGTYWANTSSNSLVSKLIREGASEIKQSMEQLLKGEHFICPIDEQIVYNQLDDNEEAIWSLLVASGYLKILSYEQIEKVQRRPNYELALTNGEVRLMFEEMISGWFGREKGNYNRFINAMLAGDLEEMNEYMNEISCEIFSYFDTGKRVSKKVRPERFYHGFVLGLLVDLKERYHVTSNRESGFGRYDIMLEPVNLQKDDAIIIEFKVFNGRKEKTLEETVASALAQIEQKQYEVNLIGKGISREKIRKYAFAFEGKNVLIDSNHRD